MKKIRWGIAGPGAIAVRFAEAIKRVDCAELVAVASRDKGRAEKFAKEYSVPLCFCGYEQMAESNEVDAVYVATQNPFHKSCAEIFLNAGKHVLCEKPLCVNAYQGQKLKECAEQNKVFLMEALWTRFLPAIKQLQEIVEQGEIGEVLGVEADFCFNMKNLDNRVFKHDMAGGSLIDVGIYGLNFAAMFLGTDPETITAVANVDKGVDLHTNILLKYKNGALANITSAVNVDKPEAGYIYGTKGRIYLPCFYGPNEFFITTEKGERHIVNNYIGNGFEEEIIESCKCITQGKLQSDIMPMEESIKILKQMDAIRAQIGVIYSLEGENENNQ